MINPRFVMLLTFALGMSSVGLIYIFTGRWWPSYLAQRLTGLTRRESTVRACIVIAVGLAIGVVCLLYSSFHR